MSYAPEVIADSSGEWAGNAMRFATHREAEVWVWDLSMRWLAVRDTRVVESSDAVNYRLTQQEDGSWLQERVEQEEVAR